MLIVLEGIDGSGKTSILNEVYTRLFSTYTIGTMDYPNYEKTIGGELAGKMLNGNLGGLTPEIAATIFALDRFEQLDILKSKLLLNQLVLANRYVTSNIAYQASRYSDNEDKEACRLFIERLEYEVYRQPIPDLVITLDIPVNLAIKNIENKAKRSYTDSTLDLYEQDRDLLSKVQNYYLYDLPHSQAERTRYYRLETCRNGHLLAIETIAIKVCELISKEFDRKKNNAT
jgi:dTMP kinase